MNSISVYKRKDERFEARVYLGVDNSGKRKYKSFYGHTEEEAKRKMLVYCRSNAVTYNKAEMTVGELILEWLSTVSIRIKASTYANYRTKCEKHLIPAFSSINCCELCSRQIYDFIENKRTEGLSVRYILDIITLLKSVYRYAAREYNIRNVTDGIVMPKAAINDVRLLTSYEQDILKRYIARSRDTTSLGIALSMFTGIRIGELCALKWEDIDLNKRTLTVRKTIQRIKSYDGKTKTKLIISEPKSSRSKRVIPIPDCIMDLLLSLKADGDKYVISNTLMPTEPRTMQYRFARILSNENLPSVHFHSLRHAFATRCIELGFDVKTLSEILGHSSVELTLNRYVHSSFDRKRECMARLKWAG